VKALARGIDPDYISPEMVRAVEVMTPDEARKAGLLPVKELLAGAESSFGVTTPTEQAIQAASEGVPKDSEGYIEPKDLGKRGESLGGAPGHGHPMIGKRDALVRAKELESSFGDPKEWARAHQLETEWTKDRSALRQSEVKEPGRREPRFIRDEYGFVWPNPKWGGDRGIGNDTYIDKHGEEQAERRYQNRGRFVGGGTVDAPGSLAHGYRFRPIWEHSSATADRWKEGTVPSEFKEIQQIRADQKFAGDPTATKGSVAKRLLSGEAGFTTADLLAMPITLPLQIAHNLNNWYDRWADSTAQRLHIGRRFPEIEAKSPEVAKALRLFASAPQYYKEMFRNLYEKYWAALGPDREKIAMMMADSEDGQWLKDNHADLYRQGEQDPQIQLALEKLKPLQRMVYEARQAMGGVVGEDEQHMRRTYPERVAGLGDAKVRALKKVADDAHADMLDAQADPSLSEDDKQAAVDRFSKANKEATIAAKKLNGASLIPAYDKRITRQAVNNKGRVLTPEEYWERGTKEIGPSFGPEFIGTMTKLDEHNVATRFMNEATLLEKGDEMPLSIYYNGQRYFHPDWMDAIKKTGENGTPEERRDLAYELNIPELPAPNEVEAYGWHQPNKPAAPGSLENAVLSLPNDENLTADQVQELKGKAYGSLARQRAAARLYLGPKVITDAMDGQAPQAMNSLIRALSELRRFAALNVVGQGFGIPHVFNLVRTAIMTMPGGMLNPVNFGKAFKTAFDKQLHDRGIQGIDDPTMDMLLRHAGATTEEIEPFKDYMKGMWDIDYWKKLLADGRYGKLAAQAISMPFRILSIPSARVAQAGRKMLFGKPGEPGMEMNFRLEYADRRINQLAKEHGISEEDARKQFGAKVADETSQWFSKSNRAAWTDFEEKFGSWFPSFPGWFFRSLNVALRHPIAATAMSWALVRMANEASYRLGYISDNKDRNDLTRIHFGKYSVRPVILSEPMAQHALEWASAGAESLLRGEGAKRAIGQALRASPGSLGKTVVDSAAPIVQAPIEIGFNQLTPGGRQIVQKRDFEPQPSKAAKKLVLFGLEKAFPGYSRLLDDQGNLVSIPEYAGSSTGFPYFKKKK
jgi:hypothetical protein